MKAEHILIVEDEADIGELIKFHLENEGHTASVIESGRDALERIRHEKPALVILDIMLPDLDGLEVCRRLKWDESTRGIPLLIVSAKGEESDIVTGLELGADDYVTKPFSPKVLIARMRNILRRYATPEPHPTGSRNYQELAGGQLVIDLDRHAINVAGEPIELTRTEFGILQYLASRPGFVRTRDQITSAVHGENAVLTSRTVDVHVTAIRRKLGDLGSMLRTVRGVGYRLDESAASAEARN
ncbi:MAG: response regulator transcription factor [Phycisphaerales bacterium]|nr:response regulator transcription factor [Phycisphaerales bacterium]